MPSVIPSPRPTRVAGIVTSLALLLAGLSMAPAQAAEGTAGSSTAGSAFASASAADRAQAAPSTADRAQAAPSGDRARTKALKIKSPEVACECGGAGYLWGWRTVGMRFTGVRKGHTYRVLVKGGGRATSTYSWGYASFSNAEHDFEFGRTYSFFVKEYKRKKVVRKSPVKKFTIPTPVGHPRTATLEVIEHEGEAFLVAGRTYSVSYDGEWQAGTQFAKGVDRYSTEDGGFGWYQEEGYALPWTEHAPDASLTLSPTEQHLGQQWNIYVVGSRPAPKDVPSKGIETGDPVRGSEWGHRWFVSIISEEEAAAL